MAFSLLCVIALPLLAIFHSSCGRFSAIVLATVNLSRAFEIGRSRTLLPVAAKMALQNAATTAAPQAHRRRRRSVAIDDIYVRLIRRFTNSSYPDNPEIRLVDAPRGRNLAASHNAGAEPGRRPRTGRGSLLDLHQAASRTVSTRGIRTSP